MLKKYFHPKFEIKNTPKIRSQRVIFFVLHCFLKGLNNCFLIKIPPSTKFFRSEYLKDVFLVFLKPQKIRYRIAKFAFSSVYFLVQPFLHSLSKDVFGPPSSYFVG